ncbi:MgtC/SapB family protein [Erythrobacter litoralis]|uniref:Protein MgtC n=1 Tax=Erythrobacter litoralis (strain HTCC2594) TaxID=314225 RepID=Q2N993_ERYLH|nr:MgtC/SapB family protein [Erythrobacter litoralis]ABC63748.1 membrane protein, MgtC/SapB family protein [Erythrobacter litoralis HTCC2594]
MTELFASLRPDTMTWLDVALRVGMAALLPFLIGLERFLRRKPIDFRPFVIISLAACGLLIGSIELLQSQSDKQAQIDPTRVIEGVITGIGFIGAGAMFRRGDFVQGAGSAAAIWCAGAIGVICGMGEVWLAAIVAGGVLLLLIASAPFTERWDPDGGEATGEQSD